MTKPGRKISVTVKTREIVVAILDNLSERKFTDAEREMEDLKERNFPDDEFRNGYLNALEGLMLSVRTNDDRDFYNRTHITDKTLDEYVKEFKKFRKLPIRTNFDQGFFTAWTDIIQYRVNTKED